MSTIYTVNIHAKNEYECGQTTQESHTDPKENSANVGNTETLRQTEFMAHGLQS